MAAIIYLWQILGAYHILDGVKFVKRKATTSKSKQKPNKFAELRNMFGSCCVSRIDGGRSPRFYYWTTGIRLVFVSPISKMDDGPSWYKESRDSRCWWKETNYSDFMWLFNGRLYPLVQLTYQGKSSSFDFPPDWNTGNNAFVKTTVNRKYDAGIHKRNRSTIMLKVLETV